MEDICVSVIAKIAEYTVHPILHHAQYLFCFNNFARNLPEAKRELELTRDSVKERVKEATNRTEKVEPAVEKWLKDVENVLQEVEMLEGKVSAARKSFFRRQCQYFLAKEVARKRERMTQLNHDNKFEPFSRLTRLPGIMYFSSKNFVLFKSTESAYNKLLEALKDDNVCMIGLRGIGGSGKTTLVKEVGKKVEELELFEKVVMVTVSQTPNIRNIQGQIADQLGLKLEEESDLGRAQRLSQRLRDGTTLLILDDVWEKLDFEALGIPFNENNKGCGVLLTTRSREVCTSMQCQSIIELGLLTSQEAWTLFKLSASITDDSPDALKVVARKIVNECKGLPIAIVTVGSTLREKTFEEWELALSKLEESQPLDVPRGLRSPYVCLKLSYDNLTNQLSKSLFLLCSIFPEDHENELDDLFRFQRGLGLTGTFGTMDKAKREMHVAVNILLDACLLLHANKKERIKMHDMVRDVALWIASERGQAILVSTVMDPRFLVEDETTQDKRAISLWDLENGQLLDGQLNCPTLEILLLHSPNVGFEVSNAYLEGIKMLKILAFLRFSYKWELYISRSTSTSKFTLSVQQSIESLKNLRTLCLRGYKLGDISILESLQGLEILDLRGSSFEELPNGIVALKKLKLLDLYSCWIEKNNAYDVIGRCLQLEELYLFLWTIQEDFPYNVSFTRLRRYVVIHAKINIDYKKYSQLVEILEKHRPSRACCIEGFNASAQSLMSLPIKDLFQRAEELHLMHLQGGYKNVIPTMDQQGMNQLIFLILEYCSEIECLFDGTIITNTNDHLLQTKAVLSSLVTLRLRHMYGLQEVFRDPASRCSLKNLEELMIENCTQLYNISFPRNSKLCRLKFLRIERCQMLTSLFTPSIVQTLEQLEELKVSECSKLKHIIGEDEEQRDADNVSNQSHSSLVLSKLKFLRIEGCERLEYIFPLCFAQGLVRLEMLSIRNNCELKYVFGTEKEHYLSVYQHHNHHQTNIEINLLNLKTLRLDSLSNLVDIWPEYCHPRLPNLKVLRCNNCPRLSNFSVCNVVTNSDLQQDTTAMDKEILWMVATTFNQLSPQRFSPELRAVSKFRLLVLTHLKVKGIFQLQIRELGSNRELVPLNLDLYSLILINLPQLRFIWKGPTEFLSLHMLRSFHVNGCPKLKTIFSSTIVRSLPKLTQLKISNCVELEQIFDSGDAQELKSLYTCSQQMCFPKLRNIEVQKCNKLKCLFYNFMTGHFPSLENLEIKECSRLEKVFAFEHETDDEVQEGTGKDGEQVLLQNLRKLTLIALLSFREIHHGFKLKQHVKLTVVHCPRYFPKVHRYVNPMLQ